MQQSNKSVGLMRYAGILLTVVTLAGCTINTLEQAHELLQSGDFLGARDLYTRTLERDPLNFAAHYGLGMSWCAEAIFKSELGIAEPGDWYPAIYHTTLALNIEDVDEVKRTLAILHFNLGTHFRKIDENEFAIARLEQSLSYDSTLLKALNLLGALYHEAGDIDNAEYCYNRTIALRPDYAIAHFNLGTASWARGEHLCAYEHFLRALNLDPANTHFSYWMNLAAQRAGVIAKE